MYYKTNYNSPIGKISIVSDKKNIVGLWLEGQKYFFDGLEKQTVLEEEIEVLCKAKKWLERYFHLEKPSISELPLAPTGGEFRQRVWKILCEIPYGEVCTYGEIGKKVARDTGKKSMSAQAIGGAVGHNPISIIIPCHRVVGANGNLTGYAGGIDKKIWLLKMEKVDVDQFFVPKKGKIL